MGLSIRVKLIAVFVFVFGGMAVAAGLGVAIVSSVQGDLKSLQTTTLPAVQAAGRLHLAVAEYRDDQLAYLNASNAAASEAAAAAMAQAANEAKARFDELATLGLPVKAHVDLESANAAWADYLSQPAASVQTASVVATFDSLAAALDDLQTETATSATATSAGAGTALGQFLVGDLGLGLVLAAMGCLAAFLVTRGLLRGVSVVSATLESLAEKCVGSLEAGLAALAANDLTVAAQAETEAIGGFGGDEIGRMAAATNAVLGRLHSTVDSYEQARMNMASALAEVHSAAQSVARTAAEVNGAAIQSGHGSQQIAQTISQVAAGAADQANAATETSGAVADLRNVIEQVRSGASETARSVEAQAVAVHEMTRSIRLASRASSDVQSLGGAAGEAASNGSSTVRQTVDGMARIGAAMRGAATKVTELGAKSDQIGAIVETIDDIAEQTNLLALNAAIEAARAGEQGKGFAVVADEVRKLAERSGRATKEIAALIAQVQAETEAAVKAMAVGAAEVEAGTELAGRSGAALDEIASAVESSNAAVARIVEAMGSMQNASAGLVSASDAIASIADGTNSAAELMSGSAEQVTNAVDSIAAISEENSASAEEVSAATEQMSAQSEELVASATSLAEMASALETLAARFRLGRGNVVAAPASSKLSDDADAVPAGDRRARRAA